MPNRRNTYGRAVRKRPRIGVLVAYGAIACVGLVLAIVAMSQPRRVFRPSNAASMVEQNRPTKTSPEEMKQSAVEATSGGATLIDDDGKTPWASPTDGRPLDLAYIPPGTQLILALRPKSFLRHAEGRKVIDGLGPLGARAVAWLEQTARMTLDRMERLVIGLRTTSEGEWLATLVIHTEGAAALAKLAKNQGETPTTHRGETYLALNDLAYYVPSSKGGTVLVVAPLDAINEIIDLAGEPPPLRRDVERLLAETDADRMMSLVLTPNTLFSDGGGMFEGGMSQLRQPLFWFLGDELSAATLSLHWDEDFFVELTATPTLDTSPERAARTLAERVGQIPDSLEAYVVGLQPQLYGRLVVARFPAMIRKLSSYTRSGFDSEHAVLNAYLPSVAGHNLLMGAELTLAEPPGGGMVASATSPTGSGGGEPKSLEEKLRQRTTLRFVRDTLDAALKQLSQDTGIAIVIRGSDLQADGITKNQSFGIDLADKTAEEVLLEILRLANPDKTATGPGDVKQKLVYVIDKGPEGKEQILVTTRAAAATRGDRLPAAFQAVQP